MNESIYRFSQRKECFIITLISITGASGTMGRAAVDQLMKDHENRLRILLRKTKRGKKAFHRIKKRYGNRAEVIFGDIRNGHDCAELCDGADYLLHLAAVIPPQADHDETLTLETNRGGTANLIRAVLDTGNQTRFIHISTVAVYGNRNEKHPWGRVGDPRSPVRSMCTDRAKRSRNTASWNPT